jgi:hypothetical protein
MRDRNRHFDIVIVIGPVHGILDFSRHFIRPDTDGIVFFRTVQGKIPDKGRFLVLLKKNCLVLCIAQIMAHYLFFHLAGHLNFSFLI